MNNPVNPKSLDIITIRLQRSLEVPLPTHPDCRNSLNDLKWLLEQFQNGNVLIRDFNTMIPIKKGSPKSFFTLFIMRYLLVLVIGLIVAYLVIKGFQS